MTLLDFVAREDRINWQRRVADFLAALPSDGFTPAQDWQIIEALAVGGKLPDPAWKGRALRLLDGCRDTRGILSLDGRLELIRAIRERAG